MRKYRPSNGTEGIYFMEEYCEQCINERFIHTSDHKDKKCQILSDSMLYDLKDPEYPCEWQYNEKDEPVCTAFVKWDWNNDDDNGDFWRPKLPVPVSDNQLCFPFIMDEVLENHRVCELTK